MLLCTRTWTCCTAPLVRRHLFPARYPWLRRRHSHCLQALRLPTEMQTLLCENHHIRKPAPAKLHEPQVHGRKKDPSVLLAKHGRSSTPLLWPIHPEYLFSLQKQGFWRSGRWGHGQRASQQQWSPTDFSANETVAQEDISYLWMAAGACWKGTAVFVIWWGPCPQRVRLAIAVDWQILPHMGLANLGQSLEFRCRFSGHAWRAEHW